MRQPLVIANWKMHGERAVNAALLNALLGLLKPGHARCVICPPFPYLAQVQDLLASTGLEWGGQDCSHSDAGAYTGEVAPAMLGDFGARWVLLGHSERRQYHQESDALVAAKVIAAQRAGLMPVVCVGESREERESGVAESVVSDQLRAAVGDLGGLRDLVVAYEPVWAIGTGLTASAAQAQEMHAHLRTVLESIDGAGAAQVPVLYGGSVKATNASELFAQPDIDGALVGGASLDAEAFAAIVNAA